MTPDSPVTLSSLAGARPGAAKFSNVEPKADREFVILVRSVVLLAVAGASVALCAGQLLNGRLTGFVSANGLNHHGRNLLLVALGLGAAVVASGAAVMYALRQSAEGITRIARVAHFSAPLVLLGALPAFLTLDAWPDALKFALSASVFLLGLEPLFRLHFSTYSEIATLPIGARMAAIANRCRAVIPASGRAFLPKWGPALLVGAMSAFYIGYMSFYTVRNHHRFNTFTWDLGQLNNQFYNFLHGHPFRCTALIREGNWSELRNHAEAVMFFLLPIYALHPAAETLLVLQAVLLGLAGIFLYRFAARRLSRAMAVTLTAAYYLYPPLHGAQFFDIHFQPVAAAFLLAAIDCFDSRRMRWFAVFFGLAILCREDISIGTAVFGLFLILTGHRPRAGAIIVAISLTYFVLLRFVIMPAVGTWGFAEHYHQLFPEGERTFGGIIKTIVTNPVYTFTTLLAAEKLRYMLQILVPVAFLPLRRLHLALSILPGAYFTILTTGYGPTLDIGYQYSGYFIPYIFPAAALALAGLARSEIDVAGIARRRAAIATLAMATLVTTTQWGAIPPRQSFHSSYGLISFEAPTAEMKQRLHDIHELEAMVPREAVLAISDREMPHVANRLESWNVSVGFEGADYILYGTVNAIPPDMLQVNAAIAAGYTRLAERPGLVLLKKPGR